MNMCSSVNEMVTIGLSDSETCESYQHNQYNKQKKNRYVSIALYIPVGVFNLYLQYVTFHKINGTYIISLTHLCLMEFPSLINGTSPFPF